MDLKWLMMDEVTHRRCIWTKYEFNQAWKTTWIIYEMILTSMFISMNMAKLSSIIHAIHELTWIDCIKVFTVSNTIIFKVDDRHPETSIISAALEMLFKILTKWAHEQMTGSVDDHRDSY